MDGKYSEMIEFIVAHRELGIKPHKILDELGKEFKKQLEQGEDSQYYGIQLSKGMGIILTYVHQEMEVRIESLIRIREDED